MKNFRVILDADYFKATDLVFKGDYTVIDEHGNLIIFKNREGNEEETEDVITFHNKGWLAVEEVKDEVSEV